MQRAIVLGAGMVGSVIARDLAEDEGFTVSIADVDETRLAAAHKRSGGRVEAVRADLSDRAAIGKLVEPYDVVLGALASKLGFGALRAVIEAKKPYCDISFMEEDAIDLDGLAKEHGVAAVVDCGVAPGMSHMIAGYGADALDSCDNIEIYVGGLPVERRWPFEYKAAFAPRDVIAEYTRPTRLVEHGEMVVRPALSEPELMDFPGVGTLEAFNTDGLRSLATTMPGIPFMKEKTLRYPGHIETMRVLREMGLFGEDEIEVDGKKIRPVDLTAALMFPMWSYDDGERDLTVMRIIVDGVLKGERTRMVWDMLDTHDAETDTTSMARTTAFPCAIVARMLARREISGTGVIPPEFLGKQRGVLDHVLGELDRRGVRYVRSGSVAGV